MGIVSKIATITVTLSGVALFSQLPEFAQQYRQRLGGAVDELKIVVSKFDADAAASTMTRQEALDQLKGSELQFPKQRGASMEQTFSRFASLSAQQMRIEQGHVLARPLHVFASPDAKILKGAWEIFEPAVPLNTPGAVYGGAGGILGFLLARLGLGFRRKNKRRQNDAVLGAEIQKSQAQIEPTQPAVPKEKTTGLLEASVEQPSASNANLADVRFQQQMRGDVDAHGMVVRKTAGKLD